MGSFEKCGIWPLYGTKSHRCACPPPSPRFVAPRWGRPSVVTAAVVVWWINTGLALLCTILLPFYMFVRRQPL